MRFSKAVKESETKSSQRSGMMKKLEEFSDVIQ